MTNTFKGRLRAAGLLGLGALLASGVVAADPPASARSTVLKTLPGTAARVPTTVATPQVEGLEVLRSIGSYSGELRAYQAVRPTAADIQNLMKLSDRLGQGAGVKFDREMQKIDDSRTGMRGASDPSASFEYDARTGNFLFNGGMNALRKEGSTPNLPTQAQAAELAKKQLADLGLRQEPGELVTGHIGGLNMGISDGKGGTKIYEKLRNVRFNRTLGGLPVEGDARILVQLGEKGSVAGLIYQWPALQAGKPATREMIASADGLRTEATDRIRKAAAGAVRSKVTKADLVLYDDGGGTVEPAYHVVVEQYFDFKPGTLTMNPYDFYLPALRNSRAQFPLERAPNPAGQDANKEPGHN